MWVCLGWVSIHPLQYGMQQFIFQYGKILYYKGRGYLIQRAYSHFAQLPCTVPEQDCRISLVWHLMIPVQACFHHHRATFCVGDDIGRKALLRYIWSRSGHNYTTKVYHICNAAIIYLCCTNKKIYILPNILPNISAFVQTIVTWNTNAEKVPCHCIFESCPVLHFAYY